METQTDIAGHIERLSFALKTSKEKFEAAMNNGHEFHELKKILREIKLLENELREYQQQSEGS